MVYCGKASQGCQNCRQRRIKCDKIRPECSQCIRVGKKCPGYRDQLSLMFRDESNKVIQKAHAQWGVEQGESSSSAGVSPKTSRSRRNLSTSTESGVSPTSAGTSSPATSVSGGIGFPQSASSTTAKGKIIGHPVDPADPAIKQEDDEQEQLQLQTVTALVASQRPEPRSIDPTAVDQGIRFYIEHFLAGQPDHARTMTEQDGNPMATHPLVQDLMAAIGLAGLSNLRNDESMNTLAREKYGMALQRTSKSLRNTDRPHVAAIMRSVVMLAVFEVVKGTHESNGSAMAHIMGAAALLSRFLAQSAVPKLGYRGLLQICYSLFIPCQGAGTPLPSTFFDWIGSSGRTLSAYDPEDRPGTELIITISRFVHLSSVVARHAFVDGRPKTAAVIRHTLQLDGELAAWESRQEGKWRFSVVGGGADFPPEAAFRGQLHAYTDQWCARVWNHYRWARILVNQMLVDAVRRYPTSSLGVVSAAQQARSLAVMRRLAEDVLVSIPTHWRHPRLSAAQRELLDRSSGGLTVGVAGIPSLLHQLKVAACAPDVPLEFWRWALGVMETVWAEMGMLQAKSLAEVMRAHHDKLKLEKPEGILKRGPHFKRDMVV